VGRCLRPPFRTVHAVVELVFQVISERNERGSLIVTTNLPFGEWTKVFPDARLAKRRAGASASRRSHRMRITCGPRPFRAVAVPIVLIWGEQITARNFLRGVKRRRAERTA
jgi:hypothetical protein